MLYQHFLKEKIVSSVLSLEALVLCAVNNEHITLLEIANVLMMTGIIKQIYIAKIGFKPVPQLSVQVEANKGIVGDRYYKGEGTFSKKLAGNPKSEITFIASEEIDQFNLSQNEKLGYGDVRRNVVTQGLQLKELIGKEFSIGSAIFLGIEHCEPCAHLASTVNKKVLPHLVHTGLRAAILKSGKIEVGHKIIG